MSNDLVQIARQRIDNTQRTHWEGCERDHRECLIQRMADEIERLRATLNRQQHSQAHPPEDWRKGLHAGEADTELADLRQACREGWRHAAELEEERQRLQAEIDRVNRYAAAPPKREPLTDEQIAQCIVDARVNGPFARSGTTSFRIARAVERAHGIGGSNE